MTILAIRAALSRVPTWAWLALAAVFLLILAGWLASRYVDTQRQEAVKADRDAASVETLTKARKADERARQAATASQDETERTNDEAQDAADSCDDVLKCGFDSLRRSGTGDGSDPAR